MPLLHKLFAGTLLAVSLAAFAAPDFPQDHSDIKPDPNVTFGRLDNGVRYAVLPNTEPKGRASLRLLVNAGSLNEKDDQQGLAHFLEHMAFKGSTHYAPGTLISYFQRLGMGMGSDANANTGFERTIYELELPDTKPATMTEGLQVFADFSGGLLLKQDQIEGERGVILSEKRARDSVGYRSYVAGSEHLMPDALVNQRLPIGHADIIQAAQRDRFADFYNTWYRPDRITVVVVGDFNPKATVELINKEFGGLTARAPARADYDFGKTPTPAGVDVGYHYEAEAPATNISIETLQPFPGLDNQRIRQSDVRMQLALDIVSRRLDILAHKENAVISAGYVGVNDLLMQTRVSTLEVTSKPENWQAALGLAEQQLRQAYEYGFTADELRVAVANMRTSLQTAADSASTRRSAQLAGSLTDALNERNVYTSPRQDLVMLTPLLDSITPQQALEAFRKAWPGGRSVFVSGDAKLDDPKAEIAAAWKTSAASAVAAPPKDVSSVFPYTTFGTGPGAIADQKQVDDLAITQLTFANGVRVNIKKTPFEANTIRFNVRVGGGELTEPKDQPGLSYLANLAFRTGGLDKLSWDDLQNALAGKQVGLDFGVGSDAFQFSGSTNAENLKLQLQLLSAYLTHAGYRPEALSSARKAILQADTAMQHTPEGMVRSRIQRELASNDPRFGVPPRADAMARNLQELKAWLDPQLQSGPLEISIVGDVDTPQTVTALQETLGALPARSGKPAYAEQRVVHYPAKPLTEQINVQTEIDRGIVFMTWGAPDGMDVNVARRFNLLSEAISNRLYETVRTKMGSSYSPSAFSNLSDTYPGYGILGVAITVEPGAAQKVADAVRGIAADLKKDGITDDELERARAPILTSIRDSAQSNPYWLQVVLNGSQERPERLNWARTRMSGYEHISKAEINALIQKYVAPDNVSTFLVLPASKDAAAK